jgi:uncharacterized protein YrzB (UPF0473 family)
VLAIAVLNERLLLCLIPDSISWYDTKKQDDNIEMRLFNMSEKEACGCGQDHDHDHNHDHENGEDEGVFIVTDDDGTEHELVMVYSFDVEEKAYAVLLDRNDPEADGFIFRIEEDGESAFLVDIEDSAEWEKAAEVYNQLMEEEDGQEQV